MAQTVVGFFDNAADAQKAVDQLVSSGFNQSSIDVSSGGNNSALSTSGNQYDNDQDRESGITRFFKNLFGDDDDEVNRYSRVGSRSGSIVTVHAQSNDEAERAADLLDDYGAIDVNERASSYESGNTSADFDRTSAYSTPVSDNDTTINRIEEDLEVGKRTVERGGVRLRSRIVERPVEESIRLREERVTVERNPVNRVADRDELANFGERDIELTERAEVPVVNKEARVVEEIRLSKDVEERQETIRDTVRSTEVDIENLSNTDKRSTTGLDTDFEDDTRSRNSSID